MQEGQQRGERVVGPCARCGEDVKVKDAYIGEPGYELQHRDCYQKRSRPGAR